MSEQTIIVHGMSCQHCVNSIEGALRNIGVIGQVDLMNKSVRVQYDETKIHLDHITQTIQEQGYTLGA